MQSSRTKQEPYSGDPIWNEMITFDVRTGRDPLKVSVVQCKPGRGGAQVSEIGYCEIPLTDLSQPDIGIDPEDHIDQQKQDRLFNLGRQGNNGEILEERGQIRLGIQWIYSKVKLLQDYGRAAEKQLEQDRLSLQ